MMEISNRRERQLGFLNHECTRMVKSFDANCANYHEFNL